MIPTHFRLAVREETQGGNTNNFEASSGVSRMRVYIIAFSVAGALLLGAALWSAIRFIMRRVQTKTRNRHGGPLTSVHGQAEEITRPADDTRKSSPEDLVPIKGPPLSHTYIASTVVLPQRALISQEGITKYNNVSGTFSRPFVPTSNNPYTSKRLSASNHHLLVLSPSQRSSYASMTDGDAAVLSAFPSPPIRRFSGLSALAVKALKSPQPHGELVHQIFTPLLPDELRLTRLGERLTVVKSFDDGWCIVSRAKYRPPYHSNVESLYTPKPNPNGVELGAVPAWCFMKTVNGLRSERPVRRSSLGITMDVDTALHPGDEE